MPKRKKVELDRRLLRRLAEMYRPFRFPATVAFAILIANQFVSLVPAYLLGWLIDGLSANTPIRQLIGLVVLSGVIKVINTLIIRWRINYEFRHIDYKLPKMLSLITLENLFKFSPGQNRDQNSGKIQSIVNQGEAALTGLLPLLLYNVIPIVSQVIIAAAALLWFDWLLGSLIMATIGIYFGLLFWITKKYDHKLDAHQDFRDYKNTLHTEILRNLPMAQIAGQETAELKRLDHRASLFASYGERMWQGLIGARNYIGLIVPVSEAIIMSLAVWFVIQGKYGAGAVVTMFMWMNRSMSGINQLAYYHKQLTESMAAIRKYFVVMDVEPAIKEVEDPVRLTMIDGRIEFHNVSFRYPSNKQLLKELDEKVKEDDKPKIIEALRKVSFVIEPGERIAFVGESGAGKSTIISLLQRAYDPNEGAITIDGHDLRTLDLSQYRSLIGHVEQDVKLRDTTLKFNIMYSMPAWQRELITEEDFEEVLETSRINAFRDRLTEGPHTKIGENGVKLSGGERQRVGVARALIKNPNILILDEATSNLDAVNEQHIRDAVDEASRGRTTIIIAHRLSTVKHADRIFVLKKGRIAGVGTHNELLGCCEEYQKLVSYQLA